MVVTECIGTAARSKAPVMLRAPGKRDCCRRLLNALHQLREEKNWAAEAAEEVAGRQLRAEVAQMSGCSEKK